MTVGYAMHGARAWAVTTGLVAAVAASATPVSFEFSQQGFPENATVTGSFSGEDRDGNGQLSSFASEITDFSLSFSGNSQVPAFSLGLGDLFGLVYDLDGGPLGDGATGDVEGIGATDGTFFYDAGPGPVALCGIGIECAFISGPGGSASSMELIIVGLFDGVATRSEDTTRRASSDVSSPEILTQSIRTTTGMLSRRSAILWQTSAPGAGATVQAPMATTGLAAGGPLSLPGSVWVSASLTHVDNDFASTAFDGDVRAFLAGADWLLSDTVLAGLALGYERTDMETFFNGGEQESDGVTIAGYGAWLFSERWSVDAMFGGTRSNIDQFRTQAGRRIDSEVDTWRWFAAANLNAFLEHDRWLFSAQAGLLYAQDRFDDFVENTGVAGGLRNPDVNVEIGQVSVGGDVGYAFGSFTPFVSGRFVHDFDRTEVEVGAGQPEPSGDRSEFQVGFGVRYFGADNGISGTVEVISVQGREDVDNLTLSAMLRIEL